jgi:hypothetical protein
VLFYRIKIFTKYIFGIKWVILKMVLWFSGKFQVRISKCQKFRFMFNSYKNVLLYQKMICMLKSLWETLKNVSRVPTSIDKVFFKGFFGALSGWDFWDDQKLRPDFCSEVCIFFGQIDLHSFDGMGNSKKFFIYQSLQNRLFLSKSEQFSWKNENEIFLHLSFGISV